MIRDDLRNIEDVVDGMPEMTCPKCKAVMQDFDGFGVLFHAACGFCKHASRSDGVCDYCGDRKKP